MSRRTALILTLLVLATALPADARRRCRGAFRRSCLNRLYNCFDARGSCNVDVREMPGIDAGRTITCFANGARTVVTIGLGTDPSAGIVYSSTDLFNAAGEACVTSYAVSDTRQGTTDIDLVNVQSGQNWRMVYTPRGLSVFCPNRRRAEHYSQRQVQRADCGSGSAQCQPGECFP
jgi:hypothetical protein